MSSVNNSLGVSPYIYMSLFGALLFIRFIHAFYFMTFDSGYQFSDLFCTCFVVVHFHY
jgi:hypothetical protein